MMNETLIKVDQIELNPHVISNSSILGTFFIIFIGLCVVICVKISYKKSEQNYTIVREPKPDTEMTIMN